MLPLLVQKRSRSLICQAHDSRVSHLAFLPGWQAGGMQGDGPAQRQVAFATNIQGDVAL